MSNLKSIRKWLMLALLAAGTHSGAFAGNLLDDTFFRDGKYYVVAGILIIIFLVLFIFLIRLDRKVTKLEKEQKS
ncbi:MAG: hypothetical protein H6608_03640 [Flavobacteriales bacterium]|nr:hypothetical protein [Bacteroidota bacterium]MCB9240199.1 hypothetical protein [Flavobacteriales bacterium]